MVIFDSEVLILYCLFGYDLCCNCFICDVVYLLVVDVVVVDEVLMVDLVMLCVLFDVVWL